MVSCIAGTNIDLLRGEIIVNFAKVKLFLIVMMSGPITITLMIGRVDMMLRNGVIAVRS